MSKHKFSPEELAELGPSTRALHAGWRSDPTTGAFALPIYPTAGYEFASTEEAAEIFALDRAGYIYSRLGGPSQAALEEALAAMDGGVAAVAASSGQAAFTMLTAALASAGDHVVVARTSYGGTITLLKNLFPRFGIDVSIVDIADLSNVRSAITSKTRALICEVIGNPTMNVAPLEDIAKIAHDAGVPLVIDNTFSPSICEPIKWGADVVVYSTTKYISGLGTVVGGAIVDSGAFDWNADAKWKQFNAPDPAYHDIVFTKQFGRAALAAKIRASIMRDMGSCASPFDCYMLRQSMMTLPLRMERHSDNARAVAEALSRNEKVAHVSYPGLASHPQHDLAKRYLGDRCGGMIAFEVAGGYRAGVRFLNSLKMLANVANVGDSRSMAIHSASTTHAQLTPEERAAAGIGEGMIRLSIGLEDVRDVIADIDQALEA